MVRLTATIQVPIAGHLSSFMPTVAVWVALGNSPAKRGKNAVTSSQNLNELIEYWNAANYLTVAQIYLRDNPLLREPLTAEHIKPRLLGHWGTSPGLNLVYVHLNKLITDTDTNVLYVAGPGHGGPAIVANTYLEGSYSDCYPEVSEDRDGLVRLIRRFSTPGGIPSHVSVPTPGSIHEGGELGYALAHAFGAAFDNPNLLVACVVGDGEAETGPLAASWESVEFLNPARDGAVLPILHLNGYKISGPTVMGRWSDERLVEYFRALGYSPRIVSGHDVRHVHETFADVLRDCYDDIQAIQEAARQQDPIEASPELKPWPLIVLRTPKGWTGPDVVDDKQVQGTFRSHQVPLSQVRENPEHLRELERWLRSYQPNQLFDENGTLVERLRALAPKGPKRMGSLPQSNGGAVRVPLRLPDPHTHAVDVNRPGRKRQESTRQLGEFLREVFTHNASSANFRLFCPDETNSNRLTPVFDVENRMSMLPVLDTDEHVSRDGRVLEVLSEHLCEGWLEGYLLTGRHGLFATYEAFAMVSASMTVQHAKWLEESTRVPWRSPVSSLNILLTSTCWRNDHNGFSHQGPGLIDVVTTMRSSVSRVYLPPDANCLLSVANHCLQTTNYVNLIVIDKQPQLQYLDFDAAAEHCKAGAGIWDWASSDGGDKPDVVLACAGDVMTMETLAAAELLRDWLPELKVRLVNVVDLMKLYSPSQHPHGLDDESFAELFTNDVDVVFAFHGYAQAIHHVIHGRANAGRFHVRGFVEQGTTTTPFDMVVLNEVSRYHLAAESVRRAQGVPQGSDKLLEHCAAMIDKHDSYIRDHFEDMPEVRDWTWSAVQ